MNVQRFNLFIFRCKKAACDNFSSSSDEDNEFFGFLPEEINFENLKRRAEESDLSIDEYSSSGESQETSDEDVSADGWTEKLRDVYIQEFAEDVGATFILESEAKEQDFFGKIFPDEIFEILAEQTNLYALQLQVERHKVDERWTPTTPEEMRCFVGLRIFMSLVDLPEIKMYWSQDKFYGDFAIAEIMMRDRFEKLSQYIHAHDRTGYDKQDAGRDKLHLIRPLLEIVNKRCLEAYNPNQENAVDEAMIKFRGTLSFRQYMPAKPTKYGIKVWERADSKNGYVCEFQVYVGKPGGNHGREKELGRKVVERLTTHIRGKNHHVFFDNYFNSVVLHENLLANGIYGCGTVKSSAKSLPNQMRVTRGRKSGLRLQQGEAKTWQKNGITATVWQEKKGRKPVRLLSSNTNPNSPKTSVKRKQKDGSFKEIPCPLPVRVYNENMAAVDRADQIRTAYCCARKSRRWWTYILWFLVDLSISNAFVLMKESPNHKRLTRRGKEKKLTLLVFRKNLALQLIGTRRRGRKRERQVNPDLGAENHLPKKVEKRGRCKNCTKNKRDGYSRFICTGCSDMNAKKYTFLWVLSNDCFYDFHAV